MGWEQSKHWNLKLEWSFGKRGLKTQLKDPLRRNRTMLLKKMRLYFSSHREDTKVVGLELELWGGKKSQLSNKEVSDAYGFVHEMFGRGLTKYKVDDDSGQICVVPCPAFLMGSGCWVKNAKDSICEVQRRLGAQIKLGEPTVEGDPAELILALFR